MKISCGGEIREFEKGTSWKEIALEFSAAYDQDILLVHDLTENRLLELYKTCKNDRAVEFLTYRDPDGRMTYARSAVFMMLKAFYETCGHEAVDRVTVEFTIGGNFYIVPKGTFSLDEELLKRVEERMRQLCAEGRRIKKYNISVEKAIKRFRRHRMYDKSKLFRYRRVSRVNIYDLDGFQDYFYGAMVPDTSYIKRFSLVPYKEGFVLMLPFISTSRAEASLSTSFTSVRSAAWKGMGTSRTSWPFW